MSRKTLIFFIALLAGPTPAGAHRLDEYLQATRVGINIDRVTLEIDLTPGVSIASQIRGWIDTNADGQLSQAEGRAYASQVLASLALSVDRERVPLTLGDVQMPEVSDMTAGVGTIRLRASAIIRSTTGGRHQLTVANAHRPESSVYLSNALVPSDPRIQILTQQRDRDQHSLTIDYDVGLPPGWARLSWLFVALIVLAGAAIGRRGLGRFRARNALPI
jgi:hypothetical protein